MTEAWQIYRKKSGWKLAATKGKPGTGDWSAFKRPLEDIAAAAAQWKLALGNVERPWLCWNINDEWGIAQQRLVLSVGWTPIVGWDPVCTNGPRTLLPGAVAIDFNAPLGFPVMWPHFPLEFVFMWAPRLAFWHSDLLIRIETMRQLAKMFEGLEDGGMAAVPSFGVGLRDIFRRRKHRYWELLGCTTRGASEDQFRHGTGWWRHFAEHPNTPAEEKNDRARYYYESGVGVMYWKRKYRRRVIDIPEKSVSEGHCTRIGNSKYVIDENKGTELAINFKLPEVLQRLGLTEVVGPLDAQAKSS